MSIKKRFFYINRNRKYKMSFSNYPEGITSKMQIEKNDYSQNIIKPPEKNVTQGRITKQFIVNSSDRNYLDYPKANRYRINVPQEWRDIVSAELIQAVIPNTYYNISETNNIFYISDSPNSLYPIKIPEGQYSNELLIQALNGKHGDLFRTLDIKLNFSQNVVNKRLRIQSNRANGYDFTYNIYYAANQSCSPCKLNSIDKTIGFENIQYQSSEVDLSYINVLPGNITNTGTTSDQDYNVYKLVSNSVDFTSIFQVDDYIILTDGVNDYSIQVYQIKNDSTIFFEDLSGSLPALITALNGNIFKNMSILYSPNILQLQIEPLVVLKIRDFFNYNSTNTGSENSYTVIPLVTNFFSNTILNTATLPAGGIIKYFNPPLPRLPFMDIEFLYYDGRPFDFRGQENTLIFKFTCLNQPGKYNY